MAKEEVKNKTKKEENKGMKKVNKVKEVKKEKKVTKRKEKENNIKVYEKYTCFVIGILIILLFISVLKNAIFIPALLITCGLELFCIAYYFLDDKTKKNYVYGLFVVGVILIIVAIIYTIVNTI